MKGLFLNNYFSAHEGIKISLFVSLLIIAMTLFVNDTIATGSIGFIIFIFPLNNVSSLQADEASKWYKFELTTPVSRYQIILAKYISYLSTIFLGFICSLFIVIIMFFTGRTSEMSTVFHPILFGISLSLLTGAFLYPLLLKLGALKAELFTVISAVLAITIIFVIWAVINKFFFTVDFKSTIIGSISCCISVFFFIASFVFSNTIYQSKEF